jgi:hypothetical protein
MNLAGFFGGKAGNPDDVAAANQALTLFGAGMLGGAGSGQNFSSILGNAVAGAQGGYNDAQDRTMKRRYTESQIGENTSQQQYRAAQMAEMQRKAAMDAMVRQLRMQTFFPDPATKALEGGGGPTNKNAATMQGIQQNGYVPTPRDLLPLAGMGALDANDINLTNKLNDPQVYKPGDTVRNPRTGQSEYIDKLPEGMRPNGQGGAGVVPGVIEGQGALTSAVENARRAAEAAYSAQTAFGQASGKGAGSAPYELVDVPMANGQTMKVPLSTVLGMRPGAAPGSPGNLSGQMPGAAPQPGVVTGATTDTKQRDQVRAEFNTQWGKNNTAIQAAGMQAKGVINSMDAINRIGLQTGWGVQFASNIANALTSIGVPSQFLKDLATDAQVFNRFASDGVLLAQIAQAGPQTESDAKRMAMTLPNIGNTKEANELISAYIKAAAEMQVRKADYYRQAFAEYNRTGRGTLGEIDEGWAQAGGSLWETKAMQSWRQKYPQAGVNAAAIPR